MQRFDLFVISVSVDFSGSVSVDFSGELRAQLLQNPLERFVGRNALGLLIRDDST
ncbi:MAG: hypothetical protein ACR2KT_01750 [Methylocella sp.]